jgi:tRNA(fMet)-specific endonuclease VapC
MPMPGRFLLDTNAVIALFAKHERAIARIEQAREVVVPAVVMGELYYGARRSARASENLARLDDFALKTSVLVATDVDTAREYGLIKNELRRSGSPIPENDVWIAALARQHGFTLVSRDEHFGLVDDLDLESW